MDQESPPLLTVKEAARLLKRDRRTVSRWIAKGDLPARNLGGRFYVPRAAVERLLADEEQS